MKINVKYEVLGELHTVSALGDDPYFLGVTHVSDSLEHAENAAILHIIHILGYEHNLRLRPEDIELTYFNLKPKKKNDHSFSDLEA